MTRSLRLYNNYAGQPADARPDARRSALETFTPLRADMVTIYSCGPTVYSFAHIGNFRSFLFSDVLRRVLEQHGYAVRHVMNITDVGHMTEDHLADATGEDKLAVAARELGRDPYAVAAHFERAFFADARLLAMRNTLGAEGDDPALHPRATRHVAEMLALIQRLIERGHAYVDGDGQVYFAVTTFDAYGRLAGKDLDQLEAGARVAVRSEKRDPRDFALWKVDDKHLMRWDPHSPAGWPEDDYARLRTLVPGGLDARIRPGFPGWHIECSAMANAHLGELIDIHTGGEDNMFPHHECEIAQSHGALGTAVPAPADAIDAGRTRPSFSRFWLHGRHLLVDGKKMSKRDGTFFTARDLFDPIAAGRPELATKLAALGFPDGVPPNVLRYTLIATPYRQPMNFTFDGLLQSRASIERLQSRYDRLRELADPSATPANAELVTRHAAAFDAALDDDLNVAGALGALFELVTALNQQEVSPGDAALAVAVFERCDDVLGVLDRRVRTGIVTKAELAGTGATELTSLDPAAIAAAIIGRAAAKRAKDFAASDAIRARLQEAGVVLEDLQEGVRWKLR